MQVRVAAAPSAGMPILKVPLPGRRRVSSAASEGR
jgi:hypothetical protein